MSVFFFLDKMKFSIFYFILLSSYCYCEKLLGGWSTTTDTDLKNDCLNKALTHINGAKVTNEIQAEASDLECKNQIVNGMNIKCSFAFRGQKWQCSFYKSFVQTLETQVDGCKKADDEQVQEDLQTSNEDDREDQQQAVDEDEEEEQPTTATIDDDEKDDEITEDAVKSNDDDEHDDEADIDAINQKLSEQSLNHEHEEQQQQQK